MRKLTPLMTIHMILMIALVFFHLASTVVNIGVIGFSAEEINNTGRTIIRLRGFFNIINVAALVFGILYVWNQYSKSAARYYKAFLLLHIIQTLLLIGLDATSATTLDYFSAGALALLGMKVLFLMIVLFWRDFGESNTWKLFFILLVFDVAGSVLTIVSSTGSLAFRIGSSVSRLVLDGTIALAINGKYADKARRGTE